MRFSKLYPWRTTLYGLLSAMLFFTAAWANSWFTQYMSVHMLVHIPWIMASGVFAGLALSAAEISRSYVGGAMYHGYGFFNKYGVPGLLFASFAAGYWMIPKALDDVLVSHTMQLLKFVVLFVAGMVLVESWRRAHLVIKLFFLGNFSWMAAIVGMLYQDEPVRLCNFYLQSDQEIAGIGLVIMAIALPLLWLLTEVRAVLHYLKQ